MKEFIDYSKIEDEQQLFDIIQAFELTSEAFDSIIFIFDYQSKSVLVSSSDAKFLGIDEVSYNIPYESVKKGIVMREYASEYIRIHEAIIEGAEMAKGIVGLRNSKGLESIYELRIRALKDKDGNPTGKAAGIYRNVTEYAKAVEKEVEINIRTSNIYEEISKRLASAENMESGVNSVIQFVGEFLDVSRVYIFENEIGEKTYGNNTFEWCAPGIEPQIDILQHMSYQDYGYDKLFADSDVFVCPDVNVLEEPLKSVIKNQGIKSMLHYAILDNGKFSGFIGIDDCERTRQDWASNINEVKMLAFVSDMLSMYLMKERNMRSILKTKVEEEKYHGALAHNAAYTIVADITANLITEPVMTRDEHDMLEFFGLSAPCSYDEANKCFLALNEVEVLTPMGEHFFTANGMLDMYNQGVRYESVEYYVPKLDQYYRVTPLMSKDPETSHIIAHIFGYDVTEEVKEDKHNRKVIDDALKQAKYANTAKTEFLNNMSHDIRTPMNAIIGYTNLATNSINNPEKALEYLGKIETSGNHLLALINDVLDMSQIESGKVNIQEDVVSIHSLVEDVKNIIQEDALKKGLNFVITFNNLEHDLVLADKLRLNQVFLNCLSNAVKFTPNGGEIRFTISELSSQLDEYAAYEFRVKDTGIGMNSDFVKHIFEPFERERSSTVSGIQGTGLGMSIVKNIVEMMDGVVTCESELGKGSEFIISLTMRFVEKETSSDRNEKTVVDNHNYRLDGVNILVVEDNELNREIAEVILSDLGANIVTAPDGAVAVQMIDSTSSGTYDLILMDIQMPVMNGIEATKAIRKFAENNKANIPIIAMTANAFIEDRKAAISSGMQDYITKPFQVEEVVSTIHGVLNRK